MAKTLPFDRHSGRYESWFAANENAYHAELRAVRELLPPERPGVEIGVGSGRFALPLGITDGVEPSEKMARIAGERGVRVFSGVGERLPLPSARYAVALMVTTLCFLDDPAAALAEIRRVLRPGGSLVVGFVDRASFLGRRYEERRQESVFYREAVFYGVEDVARLMNGAGFSGLTYRQTLFHAPAEVTAAEPVRTGTGEGAFVAVRGTAD